MLRRILIHDDITQHWTDCWVMIWYVLSVGNVGRTVVVVTLISVSSIGHSLNETSRTFWRGMVAKFKKLKNKYPNRNIRIIFFFIINTWFPGVVDVCSVNYLLSVDCEIRHTAGESGSGRYQSFWHGEVGASDVKRALREYICAWSSRLIHHFLVIYIHHQPTR